MVYNNKFVAVIKCNGKILREVSTDNDVILPFGAEYSILLKNLDNRRAVAEVSIDGSDVLDGRRIVIDANMTTELKGVMVDNSVKNAFKFIQKTKKIQDHRGDKIDDGFIRVKFGFERVIDYTWTTNHYPTVYRSFYSNTNVKYGASMGSNSGDTPVAKGIAPRGITGEPMAKANISSNVSMDSCRPNVSSTVVDQSSMPQAEEGITVPGSEVKQDFQTTCVGTIEDHGTIIIRLKGTDKTEPVKTPVFVSTKKECPTCGTKSRFGTNYCPDCGTNLQA
jgi:hypothetical protein